jgi:hypothetical protein
LNVFDVSRSFGKLQVRTTAFSVSPRLQRLLADGGNGHDNTRHSRHLQLQTVITHLQVSETICPVPLRTSVGSRRRFGCCSLPPRHHVPRTATSYSPDKIQPLFFFLNRCLLSDILVTKVKKDLPQMFHVTIRSDNNIVTDACPSADAAQKPASFTDEYWRVSVNAYE